MVTRSFLVLVLAACTAAPQTDTVSQADVNTVITIDGPTLQAFDIPSYDYPYGEVNRIDLGGAVPRWPADLFADTVRVHATADCSEHDQRSGAAGFQVSSSCAPGGTHALVNVGIQCSAIGGTYNNCFEALAGDVAIDHGNLTLNEGNVFAGGYIAALGTIYAEGPGGLSLYTHDTFATIRAMAGAPPSSDTPHAGSLVLDTVTPALWIYDGSNWRRLATVP